MKITDIQLRELFVPLKKSFKTALRTATTLHTVLVSVITSDGVAGYGEAPPTAAITGETVASIRCAIADHIAPALIGADLDDFDLLMQRLHGAIHGNTSAKAAVDMALYDLLARSRRKPLRELLAPAAVSPRPSLRTDVTVSLGNREAMVQDAIEAVADGFTILKIKVGKDGEADAEKIAAVRRAVGDEVTLRVDANQGWDPGMAIKNIRRMEDMGLAVELVEQPVPYDDLAGLKAVSDAVDTPILADESVFSARDAKRVIETHAADFINIKLMKTGGIYEALKICKMAEEAGVRCMMGCMLESKLGVSAAAHLAAAQKIVTMADLDGPFLCREDPYTGGPVYERGGIFFTDAYGIGIDTPSAFLES